MKEDVVAMLTEMADRMETLGDARRARAYRLAASEIATLDTFDSLYARNQLREIRGVGPSIERAIVRFLRGGIEIPASFADAPFQGAPDLHCHTTWSDGMLTLDEVVAFAERLGASAIGISDHSGSLRVARGLRPDDVRAQWAAIDALQERRPDIRILKGTECDILRDGSLDHPRDILEGFDYVIASLHQQLQLGEREQTARVLAALDDPHVTVLGHPTTRVPRTRPRAKLDLDKVFEKAAANGVALEVNGNPGRLDLDETLARRALELGAKLSLGSDGHSEDEMLAFETARRIAKAAGATEADIVNYRFAPRRNASLS